MQTWSLPFGESVATGGEIRGAQGAPARRIFGATAMDCQSAGAAIWRSAAALFRKAGRRNPKT